MDPIPANPDLGDRSPRENRRRLAAAAVVALAVVALEATLGRAHERRDEAAAAAGADWGRAGFRSPAGRTEIPARARDRRRFLYVSNSHGRTGGDVSRHLQRLLDRAAPGRYEIVDLSEPGIFAPDMLQRFLAALAYEPAALILPVAYISFSDRMKLRRQSLSARSFFKPAVLPRLAPGFWLRNWDLGLYGDALVARHLRLFRYRNDLRDRWEAPLARLLRRVSTTPRIHFLEVDEVRHWQFPDGFDQNLFDWSLYALGRDGHLGDLDALLDAAAAASVPVLAFNLPVDWRKDNHVADEADVARYRAALARRFAGRADYVDYQDVFPKDFTTYDALHPTWHGARLHALDVALRLHAAGLLDPPLDPERLGAAFAPEPGAPRAALAAALAAPCTADAAGGFRRYDPSEPENAARLLCRLEATPVGAARENEILAQLARRIRYWLEWDFRLEAAADGDFHPVWVAALRAEVDRARRRMARFRDALVARQGRRVAAYPLPDLAGARAGAAVPAATVRRGERAVTIVLEDLVLADGTVVRRFVDPERGQAFAYAVQPREGRPGYVRVDVLGDRSFLWVQPLARPLPFPDWVTSERPVLGWGA